MNPTIFHLLIIGGDEAIRNVLARYLSKNGFLTSKARDAAHTRRLLAGLEFDLLVVDSVLSDGDGHALARELRDSQKTPIMFLAGQGGGQAPTQGANDCLQKPFEPPELLTRVNALLLRDPVGLNRPAPPRILVMGEYRYDINLRELRRGDEFVRLTATEAALMQVFAASPGEAIPRSRLVEALGHGKSTANERAIDVQVTRLRRKIETEPKQPRYLQTIRGAGYMLAPE